MIILTGRNVAPGATYNNVTITGTGTAAGSTWTNLGTVTTIDINGGTIDGVTITAPVLAGAATGTYTLGGTPTLGSNLNLNSKEFTNAWQAFRSLVWMGSRVTVDLGSSWTSGHTGSGGGSASDPHHIGINTGATDSSVALFQRATQGLGNSGGIDRRNVDFSKSMLIRMAVSAATANANVTRYIQIKDGTTHGDLTGGGIGVKISNLAIYGESYGSAHGEVNLSTTMTDNTIYYIDIWHDRVAGTIKWYVNGTLSGTQSTAANIPTSSPGNTDIVISLGSGVPGADVYLDVMGLEMLTAW